MAVKKYKWIADRVLGQGLGRLDHYLAQTLPSVSGLMVSKAKIRKLIVVGGVYLNSRRVKIASKEVLPGARIEIYVDWDKLNASPDPGSPSSAVGAQKFSIAQENVLFEDDDILVLDKPAGLPTQPTLDDSRQNLFRLAKEFLEQRSPASAVYLGLHHRLDRDTSGVILLTKSRRANSGIADSFLKHEMQKEYVALVIGASKGTGSQNDFLSCFASSRQCEDSLRQGQACLQNYLGPLKQGEGKSLAKGQGKKKKFGAVHSGGDFAHTDFKLLRGWDGFGESKDPRQIFLVSAFPRTGRTHQIRAHLSGLGFPLLGDPFYGGPRQVGQCVIPRVMLHAVSLTFPHPIHQNRISVRSGYPGDFAECIQNINKMGREHPLN